MAKPARKTSISDSSPSASSSALPPPPPPSSASKGKRKRERESIGGAGENHQKHNHPHNHLGAVQDGQEDQEEPVDESERLDEQTRAKLLVVLKAMDPIPSVLTLRLPSSSSSSSSTRQPPPRTLLDLISANPIPTPSLVHAFLDSLSPPSTSLPATTFHQDNTSKVLTREQQVQRFTESVRHVVDGLGRGRRGKGVDYEPPRKVALYQKLPSFGVPPNMGGGGTFFTSAIETEEDIMDAGNAELIEIHEPTDSFSRSWESEPRLGQNSKARPRRPFRHRQPGSLNPHVKPVEFITQPSLFSSFAPSYDSSDSTISVYQSARLVQSQQALESGKESLVESLSSSNKKRRVEQSEASVVDVEDLLEKNWTRVRRLEELQRLRVLEGDSKPSDEENALASSLQSSLIQLVALRPTILTSSSTTSTTPHPALLPSPSTLLSLHASSLLAQSNPAYQGTLERSKAYALKDNATLKLFNRPAPIAPSALPPPSFHQRPQQQQQPIFGTGSSTVNHGGARPGLPHQPKSNGNSGTASPRQFVPTSRPSTLGWATGAAAGTKGAVAPVGVLQWAKTTPGAPGVGR
ncbi:hypothetical protein BDY24DRAFT_438843 [Mrakia frigida]|uniref:uncharacterized protein n=1 Tax=Mrakia frigida TaxID=29902 RepID=UPI003FCBFDBB